MWSAVNIPGAADIWLCILMHSYTHLSSQSFTKMLTHTQMDGGDTTDCVTGQRGDIDREETRLTVYREVCYSDGWINEITCCVIDPLTGCTAACLLGIHIRSCIMQDHSCLLQIEHHICSSWKLQSLSSHKSVVGYSVLLITTQLVRSGAVG